MALSFFDLFTVGIGPSSSHTVGPMRAARAVVQRLRDQGLLAGVTRVQVDPAPDNARAIRCYEKAGFRADSVIDTPDGKALIMYWDRAG